MKINKETYELQFNRLLSLRISSQLDRDVVKVWAAVSASGMGKSSFIDVIEVAFPNMNVNDFETKIVPKVKSSGKVKVFSAERMFSII